MRILFMGTPDYALEILKSLYCSGDNLIVGVVTQPDKPKGRGHKMMPPPVKVFAEENGIPVFQPTYLKDGAFSETLHTLNPDIIIVAAYGKILPKYILDFPPLGCINAHASLLPKYRGAAPIQRALMNGEKKTGVCSMFMEEGLDTGDIIFKEELSILPEDNFETLHDKLCDAAVRIILKTVKSAEKGELPREKQDDSLMTYAEKITKDDRIIDFAKTNEEVFNKIRGLSPFPKAYTRLCDGRVLQITEAHISLASNGKIGEVMSYDSESITVMCGDGAVRIFTAIPEGKSAMKGSDLIRGRYLAVGDILGNED